MYDEFLVASSYGKLYATFLSGTFLAIDNVGLLSFLFNSWRSDYCYLNKEEYNLNQSKDDSFVERVAKNNS